MSDTHCILITKKRFCFDVIRSSYAIIFVKDSCRMCIFTVPIKENGQDLMKRVLKKWGFISLNLWSWWHLLVLKSARDTYCKIWTSQKSFSSLLKSKNEWLFKVDEVDWTLKILSFQRLEKNRVKRSKAFTWLISKGTKPAGKAKVQTLCFVFYPVDPCLTQMDLHWQGGLPVLVEVEGKSRQDEGKERD